MTMIAYAPVLGIAAFLLQTASGARLDPGQLLSREQPVGPLRRWHDPGNTCACPPPSSCTATATPAVTITVTAIPTHGPDPSTGVVTVTVTAPASTVTITERERPGDGQTAVVTVTETQATGGGNAQTSVVTVTETKTAASGGDVVTVTNTLTTSVLVPSGQPTDTPTTTPTTTSHGPDTTAPPVISSPQGHHYCHRRTCYNSHGDPVTTLPPLPGTNATTTASTGGGGCSVGVSTVHETVYNTVTQTLYGSGPVATTVVVGNSTGTAAASTVATVAPRRARLEAAVVAGEAAGARS